VKVPEIRTRGYAIRQLWDSVGTKLFILLLGSLLLIFGVVGYLFLSAHRRDLEEVTLDGGERVSEVIRRNTSYHMMHNDREGMHEILLALSGQPGVDNVRIIDRRGRVSFSTDEREIGRQIDVREPVCSTCHARTEPALQPENRFRIFERGGERVLGIVTPIMNTPGCTNAACHAHPAEHRLLGVLETNLSLASADARLTEGAERLVGYGLLGLFAVIVISGLFVWRFVHVPVAALKKGTVKLGRGELGYQIDWKSSDELGDLAKSFNAMSRQVHEAQREVTIWATTLEDRVEQKTAELRQAHDQMMQAEKMASLGKMAAVVAHEINNPLSAILTYTKLVRRWLNDPELVASRTNDMCESLHLIESESRRCGDLVKNLLSFSRASHVNMSQVEVNDIVHKCIMLVQHKLQLGNVNLQLDLGETPTIYADPSQIEQLLLALVMNAIEAMPQEGNLQIATSTLPERSGVKIVIRDDGMGIPEDLAPRLFEPFVTTKESGKGVGLGLAISKTIVERHGGTIEVDSAVGRGTTFTITLPAHGAAPARASQRGSGETELAGVTV
jgi:two-component system, NtrC family, sensor kinase